MCVSDLSKGRKRVSDGVCVRVSGVLCAIVLHMRSVGVSEDTLTYVSVFVCAGKCLCLPLCVCLVSSDENDEHLHTFTHKHARTIKTRAHFVPHYPSAHTHTTIRSSKRPKNSNGSSATTMEVTTFEGVFSCAAQDSHGEFARYSPNARAFC